MGTSFIATNICQQAYAVARKQLLLNTDLTMTEKYKVYQRNSEVLATMLELILLREFGWKPFEQILSEYHKDTQRLQVSSEQEKIDRWVLRFSQLVGRDCSEYFQAFGLKVSHSTLQLLSQLEPWFPIFSSL
jgi:Peptidase M60, enhancin and enhancin-like